MAIKLKVESYCADCCDFVSEVTAPEKYYYENLEVAMTDTIIRCKNARRCEAIKRYLTRALSNNNGGNEE